MSTTPYIDKTGAQSYFDERLNVAIWTAASDANKTASLIQATKMINLYAVFYDEYGDVVTYDNTDAPQQLKDATCEQALYLLTIDPTAPLEVIAMGIASAKGTVFDKSMTADMLCPLAISLIEQAGGEITSGSTGGIGFGTIERI